MPRACPSILLLLAIIACRPGSAAHGSRPVSAAAETNTTMYVQVAVSGMLKFTSATGCTFELDLAGADPLTTWFTDRPARDAGRVTNSQFVGFIGDTEKNPVNAALVFESAGKQTVAPVELWGGKASPGKLSYSGRWLKAGAASKFNTSKTSSHTTCDQRSSTKSSTLEKVQLLCSSTAAPVPASAAPPAPHATPAQPAQNSVLGTRGGSPSKRKAPGLPSWSLDPMISRVSTAAWCTRVGRAGPGRRWRAWPSRAAATAAVQERMRRGLSSWRRCGIARSWDHYKYGNSADKNSPLEVPAVEASSKAILAGGSAVAAALALYSI